MTIRDRVSSRYFKWLCRMVNDGSGRELKYERLLYDMYVIPFYSDILLDDNRVGDVESMRQYYSDVVEPLDNPKSFFETKPISVLEVLVAMARRIDREDGLLTAGELFWAMITNSVLPNLNYDDDIFDGVTFILDRKYDDYGNGSFFPTKISHKNWPKLQLWGQAMSWISEKAYPEFYKEFAK